MSKDEAVRWLSLMQQRAPFVSVPQQEVLAKVTLSLLSSLLHSFVSCRPLSRPTRVHIPLLEKTFPENRRLP